MALSFSPAALARVVVFNLLLAVGLLALVCWRCLMSWELLPFSLAYSFAMCILLGSGNSWLVDQIDLRVSWVREPAKRLLVGIAVCVVYSLVVSSALVWLFNDGARDNWQNFWASAIFPVVVALIITVIFTSRSFLLSWRQAAIDNERLERERLQAQYEALRSQVNPHFLFNSLNVLSDLVYVDADRSATFIRQLAEVFRYVLESSRAPLVPLAQELAFARSYVHLLTVRFGDNLRVVLPDDPPPDLAVAPLSLQLLIENTVKHNVITSDEPLRVTVSVADGRLTVENNLQRRNATARSTGLGLQSLRAQYAHLGAGEVEVSETKSAFVVTLPLVAQPTPAQTATVS